jgi:DNA-directed RNA polymerase subunit H (RpoH/RPB5)
MDDITLQHYFDIKTVQLEMVQDRGYVVPKHEEHIVDNIDNFRNFMMNPLNRKNSNYWVEKGVDIGKKMDDVYFGKLKALDSGNKLVKDEYYPSWQLYWKHDNSKVLLVYYVNSDKSTGVDYIKYLTNFNELLHKTLNNIEISNVLISNNELSADSRKSLKLLSRTQFFLEEELKYNPVRHVTNQEHILLSPEQVTKLEKELKLEKSRFPDIKADNPVVQYYGWEQGDVIKTIRTERHVSILAKKSLNYRCVKS